MSAEVNSPIKFSIAKIETLQYAILQQEFNDEFLSIQTGFSFGIDKDSKYARCIFEYIFLSEEKQILKIETAMQFAIEPDCFDKKIEREDSLILPKEFARHIAMTTVSVTRGILHEKTQNSVLNDYPIPTINISEVVPNDIVIEK